MRDELGFKLACTKYFNTLGLDALRAYARTLQIEKPTMMRKADLIEEIIKVLCGEITPYRAGRGAPVKNGYVDESIFETVRKIQKEFAWDVLFPPPVEKKEIGVVLEENNALTFTETTEEVDLKNLQFTVHYAALTKEQKAKFLNFLKSL